MAKHTDILILIPTYEPEGSQPFLETCIRTLYETDFENLKVACVVAYDGPTPQGTFPDSIGWRSSPDRLHYVSRVNRELPAIWEALGMPHVLLLNNDLDFTPTHRQWLPWLKAELEWRHRVDRAGAMTVLTNFGLHQGVTSPDGRLVIVGPRGRPGLASHPVGVVSTFCALYHRSFVRARLAAFEHFLDPRFDRVGMDDVDLSFWARAEGWTLWLHQGIYVHHDAREERAFGQGDPGRTQLEWIWGPDWEIRMRRYHDLETLCRMAIEQEKVHG